MGFFFGGCAGLGCFVVCFFCVCEYFPLFHYTGAMQMLMTAVFGFIQIYLPLGFYTQVKRQGKPPRFWLNMLSVGTMRYVCHPDLAVSSW